MLSIKQFVEESLVQIAEGIQAAQERTRDMDVRISPDVFRDDGARSEIEFDMAVTVIQGSGTDEAAEARVGVMAAIVGAGAAAKAGSNKKEENSTVSRIRFSVQATLPAYHKGEKMPQYSSPRAGQM